MVSSLNITGSSADDIFGVVSSVGYRLLAKNVLEIIRHLLIMNEKLFSHFIAEKISFAY